jgi:hypothetical protein
MSTADAGPAIGAPYMDALRRNSIQRDIRGPEGGRDAEMAILLVALMFAVTPAVSAGAKIPH